MGDGLNKNHVAEKHGSLRDAYHIREKHEGEASVGYCCQRKCPWFGDIRIYAIVFTLLTITYGMYWGYIAAVLTFIERRYQMSSAMSGFILSSPEIGRMALLLFVSHFGNRFNKARVVGIAFTLVSIAVFCQTLPHYIIRPDSSTATSLGNTTEFSAYILCSINSSSMDGVGDSGGEESSGITINTTGAYAMFVIFCMLMGASASSYYSMGLTYIENNSQSNQAGKLIGFTISGWAFGPMIGMFLGAWCAYIYVDMEDTPLTPLDPAWVAAWWLGLLIISACQLLVAPFLCCFPRTIPAKPEDELVMDMDLEISKTPSDQKYSVTFSNVASLKKEKHQSGSQDACDKHETEDRYDFKGLLKSLLYLVTNPVYLYLALGYAASNLYIGGFMAFIPKYFATQFSIPVPRAILIVGLVNGTGVGIASLFGGQVISWLRLTLRGLFLMVLFLAMFLITCSMATIFTGCENIAFDGMSDANSALSLQKPCSEACHCDLTVYSPVCDDGLTYFSPCHAGCVTLNITEDGQNNMYLSCNCTVSGTAIQGPCTDDCGMLIPFIVLAIGVCLGYGALVVTVNLLVMRVVPSHYASLAIGLSTLSNSLLGWMPGPALYGVVIDSTCLVWEETSSGAPGSCWIYDLPAFRYKILGLNTGCFVVLFVLTLISFIFHRRKMSKVT